MRKCCANLRKCCGKMRKCCDKVGEDEFFQKEVLTF